ncbi:MAG: PAC2 family protein [Chloroflexota bacterium]|nr:PAC2 family protein [Chloroflexota bacterium]
MSITYSLVPEELGLRDPMLVGAFMGWPDASLGASGAIRYLVEALHAAPLATWEGDDYYDFVELRPVSRVSPPRDRTLVWPQAEFWVVREVALRSAPGGESADEPRTRSLVLFLAPEPRLRWRAYGRELADAARRCGVDQAVFFGAAYADVPHTRMPIVTGWATESRLRTRLEAQGVPFSAYQGPSSMQSAAIEACREAGIACASLFSNGPSYLTIPNANLSLAILRRLSAVFELDLDLKIMEDAAEALVRQVNSAIEDRSDQEFREHLRRLEAQFDEQAAPLAPGELRRQQLRQEEQAEASAPLNVDPQDVVRELEDFLRRRQQRPPGPEEGPREPEAGEDEGRPGRPEDAKPPPAGDGPATPP